ncbi:L,D-transpeptidase [Mesorhizobium sp. L-8-10]|uniref:L,D-transpeptidase n=1 Tax=Mesorhizobium sp. L-8-10 TaxID=2744523 RepID=UPI001928015A|nr:L,D-transpeptidase [Mesorhizobium sp. L-8-10]BCH31884.1 L,D-transpeptidase [Mesorhizobium sp. L-8-10]
MSNGKITRRGLILTGLALMMGGCTVLQQAPLLSAYAPKRGPDPRYRRRRVPYSGSEPAGTIVIDTSEYYLYHVEGRGSATRYGVGVGEQGRTLKGTASIGRKAEWPSWTPTANMMRRKPRLVKYAGGVPGGLNNPLGARALYLYRGGRDTMFRLHGTNEPWTIGHAVSSGCVRLTNDDIVHLYGRTPVGTRVLII